MPELPDVEVFRQYLGATALHKKIEDIEVKSPELLKEVSVSRLKQGVKNRSFESTRRHGKHLFVRLDNGRCLVLHFGMTGFLKYFKNPGKEPSHSRLVVHFSNGYHLAYDCQRKLGGIHLVRDLEPFISEKELGPDALEEQFDCDAFKRRLSGISGALKSALMNQKVLAGIGNVYSDEILFQAGLNPKVKAKTLDKKTLRNLYKKMREVLNTAIQCHASPEKFPPHYLIPHRKDGTCPKCGTELAHEKVSGRTASFCPRCQK